ncbi:MAG: trigger factor [Actinomycetia bacterium]|nr:trigger factor [Actinomycetes bacterium]
MQVEVERLPGSRARLVVTLPAEDVTRAMDEAFKTLVRRYEVPGFRRGKAPRHVFERYVGRSVLLREAAERLVDQSYPEAVREAGVEPVEGPSIQFRQVGDGQALVYTAEMAVKPVIDLGDYRDLLHEPLEVGEVTDELVEAELKAAAEEEAQWVPATEEDPVEVGSRVVLDLTGRREGEEEPFAETSDYAVEVGRGTLLEGLEAQLIGLKLNQHVTLSVTYPEDYPDPSVAGKPAVFDVTVKEHKRREVPPVDDELARAKGLADLKELREQMANRVRERLEREARERRLANVLRRLKERVAFEVPAPLVNRVVQRQLDDLQHTLSHLGVTMDQYLATRGKTLAAVAEEMRPGAVERVKDQLLLEALAKAEALEVTDEEVVEALRPVAEAIRRPLDQVVGNLKVSGEFEALRGNLLVDKAANFVREPQTA